MGDLETTVREEIPLLTVINNNSIMGNYERVIPKAVATYNSGRMSGNYADVAKALGLYSERVEKPEQIIPAYQRAAEAIRNGQSALLDMITANQPLISYNGEDVESFGDDRT